MKKIILIMVLSLGSCGVYAMVVPKATPSKLPPSPLKKSVFDRYSLLNKVLSITKTLHAFLSESTDQINKFMKMRAYLERYSTEKGFQTVKSLKKTLLERRDRIRNLEAELRRLLKELSDQRLDVFISAPSMNTEQAFELLVILESNLRQITLEMWEKLFTHLKIPTT